MSARRSASDAPRTRLYRRPLVWAGAGIGLVLLVAALAPWTLSQDALREEIAAQLRSSAGLYVFPRGPARISILPRPRILLDDVAFVDPKGALVVEAQTLTGDIRLLPLLGGRLEIAELALGAPRVTVDVDRAPMTSAGAVVRAAEARDGTQDSAKTDAARLGVLSLTNGILVLRRDGAPIATAERVNARLDWRTVGSPAAVTAELDWRGRRQQIVLWVSKPATLLRGGATPLTLDARSPETTFTAAGTASLAVRPRYEGRLQIATRSLPEVLAALGIDLAVPAALDAATLDGELVASPTGATVTDLHLGVGDETFEGTLALQTMAGAPPLLSGTLATQFVSLAPYLPQASATTEGRTVAEPFTFASRKGPDLDIRLSATRLRYDRLQANDVALSLSARNGRMELAIADAAAYGGQVKARAVLSPSSTAGQSDLQATVLMRAVDWGALDRDVSGQGRVTGTADVTASLQASGGSMPNMMRTLTGQGRISLTDGALGGLDVLGAMQRLDKRPLAAATDLGSGRTRFNQAVLPFDIDSGVVKIGSGEISAPDFRIALEGSVQIPDGQTAMTATVRPAAAMETEDGSFAFDIGGPWNRPSFIPDVRGLIRRSGAASPLFRPAGATSDGN